MNESSFYRSIYSKKYHFRADCWAWDRIKPENRVDGDGGKPPCWNCQKLERETRP